MEKKVKKLKKNDKKTKKVKKKKQKKEKLKKNDAKKRANCDVFSKSDKIPAHAPRGL